MTGPHFGYRRSRDAALSEDALRKLAPSVFAMQPHESRSARYTYIPTIDVLHDLASHGFKPFSAVEARTRDSSRSGYTKHMLRLRHADQIGATGADINELILINSHDGASSYQMLAGCYRLVCSNGLVSWHASLDIRIKHSGPVLDDVVRGAYTVLRSFDELDASKDAFKSLQLTPGEQAAYARSAAHLRWPDAAAPVSVDQVLAPRRPEDRDNSLWTTFQRVQENLVEGGLRTPNQRRRTRTRGVHGIDGNVALNRALWMLTEEMRKLRA